MVLIIARSWRPVALLRPLSMARPVARPIARPTPLLRFSKSLYSTKTAPPPPPPADKNHRGKVLLNRISRATTFSLSSLLVVGAAGVSVLVVGLILSELFLPSGETKAFNKAVKLIEKNETIQRALGFNAGDRVKAYGEVPGGKWVRNRPVQAVRSQGKDGKQHLIMKFHIESASGRHASVTLEQVDQLWWSSDFAYIAVDIPGAKRLYVVEPKYQNVKEAASGFLGLKWGPKRD